MFTQLVFVGAGGFLGCVLRYLVAISVAQFSWGQRLPFATMIVNIAGCFVIGILSQLLPQDHSAWHDHLRLFLIVGLLGGFTTFSTFGFETFSLIRNELWLGASLNIGLQVFAGIFAVWSGRAIIKLLV